MAWTDLYIQTTGSNLNSGSTNADSASITQTNGSWDITSNTFIATAGLPFAAVNVGDWASIYPDANTTTPYIAQVTAVNSAGLSITLSATVKFGTKPTAGATGVSCKIGGAWASLAMTNSGVALNTGTVPLSTRINVKAGTYANTTTLTGFALAGTTTNPLWWRGYKTAIGDQDTEPTSNRTVATDIPQWTWTTGGANFTGAHQWVSNISFTSANTANGGTTFGNAGVQKFMRCRFENTAANSASSAFYWVVSASGECINCYFVATSTATRTVRIDAHTHFHGCTFDGGGSGAENVVTTGLQIGFAQCLFVSNGASGIKITVAAFGLLVDNCTFYNQTNDGVRLTVVPTTLANIINNVFSNCGGYGINNNSGTNTNIVFRAGNDYYSCTSGNENGMGDTASFGDKSESGSPFVNATTDMGLVSGSSAKAGGIPGLFEGKTYTSYTDCGAAQRQEADGGTVGTNIVHSSTNSY